MSLRKIVRVSSCVLKSSRSFSCATPRCQALYGGRHTVAMLPGDGVGPELMNHVRQVVRLSGAPIDFEEISINASNLSDPDQMMNAVLSIKRNGVALKGNIESKLPNEEPDASYKAPNALLRTELDLFANVVHVKNLPNVKCKHQNVDIVLIRENTEGEYTNLEHENVPGVVESLKVITAEKSTRIAKYAFDYAMRHGRRKVTAVHKANIMKLADGLFLECCRQVSEMYPQVEFDSMIIDNCSMQMVSKPEQFDVMVMPNLYGNILVNIAAGLIGGPGLVSGSNLGEYFAVFETGTRNSGRSIAGHDQANPTAMLFAATDMLEHLGLTDHADMIRDSIFKVVCQDKIQTPDIGGTNCSSEVVQAIADDVKLKNKHWF